MKQIYRFSILLLGIFSYSNLFSQGFQVNFQGQKQQAMGCAGSALFTDGASLFFNPGAAAFSNENSVNVATTPIFANVMYVDSATKKAYRTENPVGTPFSIYGLFQFKKDSKLKYGIAVYTPFGSTVQYEKNWIGRFALTRLELKAIFVQPTIAYRITDKLGVGAGFVYSTGNVNLQKDIPVQFSDGTYGHAELAGKASGFGYNVGIDYKVNDKFSIGLNYRSKVQMNLKDGEATFTVPSSLDINFPDSSFTGGLPLPQVTTLGLGYKVNDKLDLVLDVNYVGWKAYDTLAFDYVQNTTSLADTKSARNYKSIFAFRAGASYKVVENFELRAGGGYGFSPVLSPHNLSK
ncbi:MAG: long-chain fatty acid transporter [Crocinitomicaceae bacterium]|nr:long-chain fatty acid transporter [Crocinitomicaceae bacterium]